MDLTKQYARAVIDAAFETYSFDIKNEIEDDEYFSFSIKNGDGDDVWVSARLIMLPYSGVITLGFWLSAIEDHKTVGHYNVTTGEFYHNRDFWSILFCSHIAPNN